MTYWLLLSTLSGAATVGFFIKFLKTAANKTPVVDPAVTPYSNPPGPIYITRETTTDGRSDSSDSGDQRD